MNFPMNIAYSSRKGLCLFSSLSLPLRPEHQPVCFDFPMGSCQLCISTELSRTAGSVNESVPPDSPCYRTDMLQIERETRASTKLTTESRLSGSVWEITSMAGWLDLLFLTLKNYILLVGPQLDEYSTKSCPLVSMQLLYTKRNLSQELSDWIQS